MNKFKQKFTSYLKGRDFPSNVTTTMIIAAVVFVNIIIYTLTSQLGLYIYQPEPLDLSITDSSDEIFERAFGKKVTVTFCMYEDDLDVHSTGKFVHVTAKNFAERYPDLFELRYVNVITQLDSEGEFVDLSVYKYDGRGKENAILSTSVIFECGSNYRVVTDAITGAGFADFFTLDSSYTPTSYNGEETFSAMTRWVLTDEHKVAFFTVGHGETASLHLYNALVHAGYYVEEINLRDSSLDENKFLSDAGLVVISNPTTDLERAAEGSSVHTDMERLEAYAARGGKFLVTLDPLARKMPELTSFLESYGMGVMTDADGASLVIKDSYNAIPTDDFTVVVDYASGEVAQSVAANIKDSGNRVILRNCAPLRLLGDAEPMLVTSEHAVAHSGEDVYDREGSYAVAAHSIGEDGSRLFFIPSVFFTAADAMVSSGYSNKEFITSLADEYYGMGDMPYGCRSILYDDTTLENLTMSSVRLYVAIALAIPALLAALGAVVIIKRRNR